VGFVAGDLDDGQLVAHNLVEYGGKSRCHWPRRTGVLHTWHDAVERRRNLRLLGFRLYRGRNRPTLDDRVVQPRLDHNGTDPLSSFTDLRAMVPGGAADFRVLHLRSFF